MRSVTSNRNDFFAGPLDGASIRDYKLAMENESNPEATETETKKPVAKRKGDALGKTPKRHNYMGLTGNQVVVIGHDTSAELHKSELAELLVSHPKFVGSLTGAGVWALSSPESNGSAPADDLIASIAAKKEVEIPGKVYRVPLTSVTQDLAFVDGGGTAHAFYLAVSYGRKRTRSIRMIDSELVMDFKVAPTKATLDDAAGDMLVENLVRRTLSPTLEAAELAKLEAGGMDLIGIAARLGEHGDTPTARTVANKLKLTKLTKAVAAMVDSGALGVTSAYSIADLPGSEQGEVAQQTIDNGLTVAQVKAIVKEKTGKAPTDGKPVDTGNTPSNDAPTGDEGDEDNPPAGDIDAPASDPAPPTFESVEMTKSSRPKVADLREMVDYLTGDRSPMKRKAPIKLAAAALQWALGDMSEDEFVMKCAAMFKCDVDDLAPAAEPDGDDAN